MKALLFLRLLLAAAVLCVAVTAHVKHVVLLMEENRSFDHLFGLRRGVRGLNGTEFNYVNISNPALGKVAAGQPATTINPCDPDHALPATTFKIFGSLSPSPHAAPAMAGFVEWEKRIGRGSAEQYCDVMSTLTRAQLPVLNALADEFVLFDEFFASVPGPTWPNRLFFLCGTSGGQTETTNPWWQQIPGELIPLPTIMDQVLAEGLEWRAYVNDTPWELFVATLAKNPSRVRMTDDFFEDARQGTLPALSVINPRAGMNFTQRLMANDMHPDHDTSLAEGYYKDIYEALRASPAWNETLFIITFDEHGGFYDHMPTVPNVPPPDNYTSYPDVFKFDRLGIRIPTLLISPLVPKGVVEGSPPFSQRPFPNSQYELTSVMATIRRVLNMSSGPLTKRDAWAATFEHLLLDEPRSDCPQHLPDPAPTSWPFEVEAARPLNSLQTYIATVHAHLAGLPYPTHITTQSDISAWLRDAYQLHRQRREEAALVVRCEPFYGMKPAYVTNNWRIHNISVPSHIFSLSVEVDGHRHCIELGQEGENVTFASECDAHDTKQHVYIGNDQTLRPVANHSLCVTASCVGSANPRTPLVLVPCLAERSLDQHWTFVPYPTTATNDRVQMLIGVWAIVADKPYP
jgi:phospholipase C